MRLNASGPIGSAPLSESDPLPPDDRVLLVERPSVESLYREYRPGLLRLLRRQTTPDVAGDLVQQLFARFTGIGEDRRAGIANAGHYLRRAASNLLRDQAKQDRRRQSDLHVSTDDAELKAPDQIAALEARDMLQRLERAMDRLNPRTREIFLAHRIDGYSYVEIAQRTGLSVKGVEKHMSRAIAFVDRVASR